MRAKVRYSFLKPSEQKHVPLIEKGITARQIRGYMGRAAIQEGVPGACVVIAALSGEPDELCLGEIYTHELGGS